jgi:hypothetical protein
MTRRNNELMTPSPDEWDRMTAGFMMNTFGTQGDVRVYADMRHLLLSANTLEKMYDRLLEDEQAHVIYPVYKVDPHLYLSRSLEEEFHPVWEYQGLDRQKYPQLFRKVNAFIHHPLRPRFKQPLKELHHIVPWYEGKPYLQGDTIEFAKYLFGEKKRQVRNGED